LAGRAAKSYLQIVEEKKNHITKAELDFRKEHEEKLKSKLRIRCKFDKKRYPEAYKEFRRRMEILRAIEKDDAIYENAVNRYAVMYQEALWLENEISEYKADVMEIKDLEMAPDEKILAKIKIQDVINALDRKLMEKRDAMLKIEREMAMTISAALRAIPKKPPGKPKKDTDDLF